MINVTRLAGISGGICVALGAFGAHTLKTLLSTEMLQVYETGVRYHFYHTLAILFCAVLLNYRENKRIKIAVYLFLAGIILFSGSLYLIATRSVFGIESWVWLGPITPLGGIFFISGWIMIAFSTIVKK